MSSFAAQRKARVIQSFDDDGDDLKSTSNGGIAGQSDQSAPLGPIKFGRNKPTKSSALRRGVNISDQDGHQSGAVSVSAPSASLEDGDEISTAPVVIRPAQGRSGSTKLKKRGTSSRLSFGPGGGTADEADDGATAGAVTKPSKPRRTLGQRVLESNPLRKTASFHNLTAGLSMRLGGDEERPRYSKEYLEELQSSTPNTPQNLDSLQIHDDGDEMELDQSELEGAVVVQSSDIAPVKAEPAEGTRILTDVEIRERKERRARLAQEAEFISLGGGSDDDGAQGGHVTVRFPTRKKESRLIAEDEDLGEGYDEFVSDGGLALGKKAEHEAARRHRQEMAELINAAEEGSEVGTDDSEAERRAAYEAAQLRAGMDGLQRHHHDPDADGAIGPEAIPRMKPLPKLNEVLQRMRDIVQGLEDEVTRKRARIDSLEKEREQILAREKEVQEILNQAGAKYQAVVASSGGNASDLAKMASQSPLRPLPPGIAGELPAERGLESFGATPTKPADVEETS